MELEKLSSESSSDESTDLGDVLRMISIDPNCPKHNRCKKQLQENHKQNIKTIPALLPIPAHNKVEAPVARSRKPCTNGEDLSNSNTSRKTINRSEEPTNSVDTPGTNLEGVMWQNPHFPKK